MQVPSQMLKQIKQLALSAALLLAGCTHQQPPPEKTSTVSNPGYKLDLLFTDPNGVRIYRFYDQFDWRYYAVGPGGVQMLPTTRIVTDTQIETVDVGGGVGRRR